MYSEVKRLICIALFLCAISSCSFISKQQEDKKTRDPIAVKTLIVKKVANQTTNNYIGTARPSRTQVVSTRNSGTVAKINIKKGDRVTKGQIIAVIDSPNAKSAYEIAQATLRQAQDGYERANAVYEVGGISEVKMVEVQTQYQQAVSAAAAAENTLNNCTIVSPFDAYIEEVLVESGEAVDAFKNIAKLININDIEIDFSVPENEISELREGQILSIDVPALNIKNIRASIASKGVSASLLSHSYNCVAVLDNQLSALLPGMVCKLHIQNKKNNSIIVPSDVLLLDTQGRYLWVVENGLAQKRRIEVDGFSANGVIVSSGLSEGDKIIVEAYQKVSSNMAVKEE